jgi:hypothetical protein
LRTVENRGRSRMKTLVPAATKPKSASIMQYVVTSSRVCHSPVERTEVGLAKVGNPARGEAGRY